MKKFLTFVLLWFTMCISLFAVAACKEKECEHTWGEWSVAAHSTCTTQGTKQRKCAKCEVTQTDFIDIGTHQYDMDNLVWTWNGYETAVATLTCLTDSTHTRQVNANVTEEVTALATCRENGVKTYTATVTVDGNTYSATKTEALAPLGHTEVVDEAVLPTCTETGLTQGKHCSACGEVVIARQEVDSLGHNYDIENIVWTWNGYTSATATVTCAVDDTHVRQITANITDIVTTPAGCTTEGVKTYTATVTIDGVAYTSQETEGIDSVGHRWDDGKVTVSATAVSDGEITYCCTECSETKTETFAYPITQAIWNGAFVNLINANNFIIEQESDTQDMLMVSSVDGEKCYFLVVDSYGNDEFYYVTENGTCYDYSNTDGEWVKTEMEYGPSYNIGDYFPIEVLQEIQSAYQQFVYDEVNNRYVAPTFTVVFNEFTIFDIALILTEGYITGLTYTVSEAEETLGTTYATLKNYGTTKIELPHIHIWSPWREETSLTCTQNGVEKRVCECGAEQTNTVYAQGHNYEGVETPATCETDGYTTYTCSECNDNYIDDIVSAFGHSFGEWIAEGTDTIRYCVNGCGEYERALYMNASYNGILLLTGESARIEDFAVEIAVDNGETLAITDFEISNEEMQLNGINYVTISFHTLSERVAVSAIYDNLEGATSKSEFEFEVDGIEITITKFIGASTEIVVPSHINRLPVRYIQYKAFQNCTAITSVTIPDSIQTIGYLAFSGCTALKEVSIGKEVKALERQTFKGCTSLAALNIGERVQTIGYDAFMDCTALTAVAIPDSVTEIGASAFENCQHMATVSFGKGLKTIGHGAFKNCDTLKEVVIPSNVIEIGYNNYGAFESCDSLEKVTIEDGTGVLSITIIGDKAFKDCTALKEVYIGNQVGAIWNYTFQNCTALTTVHIGDGVQTIGYDAFMDCTALTAVAIPDSVTEIGASAFENCQRMATVSFGKGLKTIGHGAFKNCDTLKEVVIPSNVIEIGYNNYGAFESCDSLEKVTIEDGTDVLSITIIGDKAFKDCTALKEVYIGNQVGEIWDYAFQNCTALTTVHIGDGVQTIGYQAFMNCVSLETIDVSGVQSIDASAFEGTKVEL